MLISTTVLLQNLCQIQQRIHIAEKQYGRANHAVKLLAVSKSQKAEKLRAVFAAGQTCFGENYLQEALEKQQQLADLAIEWHYIGQIQSNKTALIARHFDWVHTISSIAVAERLNKQHSADKAPLNCCIQVNISREETKAGVLPEQLKVLAAAISRLPNLSWRGLMALPAVNLDFTQQRQQFAAMKTLFEDLKSAYPFLDTLSMGMSADLEAAIAEGTTLVRVGTAIFGERSQE